MSSVKTNVSLHAYGQFTDAAGLCNKNKLI
jgi:hypothetical protein